MRHGPCLCEHIEHVHCGRTRRAGVPSSGEQSFAVDRSPDQAISRAPAQSGRSAGELWYAISPGDQEDSKKREADDRPTNPMAAHGRSAGSVSEQQVNHDKTQYKLQAAT